MPYRLYTFATYNKNRSVISRSSGITASLPLIFGLLRRCFDVNGQVILTAILHGTSQHSKLNIVSRLVTGVPFFQLLAS
jgi:hypothetical protein